jgi:hypothetical protein
MGVPSLRDEYDGHQKNRYMKWSITDNKDWSHLEQTFDWVADMKGVPQDKIHHAEGDVATHTQMVLKELQSLQDYQRWTINNKNFYGHLLCFTMWRNAQQPLWRRMKESLHWAMPKEASLQRDKYYTKTYQHLLLFASRYQHW